MNSFLIRAAFIGFVLTLSACANVPKEENLPFSNAAANINQLPAQTLQAGECGLFVWSADTDRRFILFAQSQKFTAMFHDGQAGNTLNIIAQDGTPTQKQFPEQSYDSGQTLRLFKAQAIDGGTRYKAGTISRKDESGWDSITPVIGVSTCR